MHAANGACKICRMYLRNRKSGEFELQILLKHPKFSPFWDKTNVHHNINLDKSSRKTSKPPRHPIRWRNIVLKQGNVTVRRTFGVHHSLLPCLKVEPMSKHRQKIHHISISDCLYSWQTKSGKLVDMVCLCKYAMHILWTSYVLFCGARCGWI